MKRYYKLLSIIITTILLGGMLMMFNGCKKEEILWWNDFENLEYILEDEDSVEKSFSYREPCSERFEFNYTEEIGRKEEYIPKVRILHKGIEKEFYIKIGKREWFYKTANGYDYDNPQVSVIVNREGGYRVALIYYLNPEKPDDLDSYVGEDHIYIIIHKGEIQ